MKKLRIRPGQGNFAASLEVYLGGKWHEIGDDDVVYRLAELAKKRGIVWTVDPIEIAGGDFNIYLDWTKEYNRRPAR